MELDSTVDFEVIGDIPEIELDVTVNFLDQRVRKSVKFKAVWERGEPEETQQILADLLTEEADLDGAELIRYQAGVMGGRLLKVKGFPTKSGKKISAGEDGEYSLESWLSSVLKIRSYHTALYKSMFSSLAEQKIEGAKRKNS